MSIDVPKDRQDAGAQLLSSERHGARINREFWRSGRGLAEYANRTLEPVEAILLMRYAEQLRGDVLEVGCGAGRVLGYVANVAHEAWGIDLSPAMVEYCERNYPNAHVAVGDIVALDGVLGGRRFDVVLAVNNVLDVFDDADRRRVLIALGALIAPSGLLIFSSHNLGSVAGGGSNGADGRPQMASLLAAIGERRLGDLLGAPWRLAVRKRNRRLLGSLEHTAADHAIVNDRAHDYGLLHYYIRRDDQERQLAEAGYELVECVDANGRSVPAGTDPTDPWLHYVARLVA